MHNYLEALDEIVSFRPLDISGNLVALIKAEKTHHRGSITVQMTSCFTVLDLTK